MNYEIVNLEEKIVVGISAQLSNNDPEMGEIIGGLWGKLYQGGIYPTIKNKINQRAIGLYYDYTGSDFQSYTTLVGNEVSKSDNSELATQIIPAGKYAKFSLHGNMQTVVGEAWAEIWQIPLDRAFTGDFEEYLNSDMENADIDIYIALKG